MKFIENIVNENHDKLYIKESLQLFLASYRNINFSLSVEQFQDLNVMQFTGLISERNFVAFYNFNENYINLYCSYEGFVLLDSLKFKEIKEIGYSENLEYYYYRVLSNSPFGNFITERFPKLLLTGTEEKNEYDLAEIVDEF